MRRHELGRRALLVIAVMLVAAGLGTAGADGLERSTYIVEVSPGADGTAALAAARATNAPVLYRYQAVLRGLAVRLTGAEAARLRAVAGVRAVTPDGLARPAAAKDKPPASPKRSATGRESTDFLGLPGGLWKDLGGPDKAGAGVVIGVIDSGIYAEHPSFAADPKGPKGKKLFEGSAFPAPKAWKGTCQAGEQFPVATCNNKLVGARYFVEGFGRDRLSDKEFLSPRDASGHGSHTAATAAGNYGVRPLVAGGRSDLGVPAVSGIAPRAQIAVYKVCWTGKETEDGAPPEGGCTNSDTVAAIDAAVADGVDVINYSVGSTSSTIDGPVERAFLGAVGAGVSVAASAGNAGPEPGSMGSPAAVPWITSVGASTIARTIEAAATVRGAGEGAGRPVVVNGKSLTGGLPAAPLVVSTDLMAPGAKPEDANLCRPGSLDPAKAAGKVVVCKRGDNARVDKGMTVRDAGGKGMILDNAGPSEELVADPHYLPAVHVSLASGERIRALLASGVKATAEIQGAEAVPGRGDVLATFSSRGPQTAAPDILKPDLTAPGVDILAADTPTPAGKDARQGETFGVKSGTSMAAPHVAGVAALLTQAEPQWSPDAIRSALMTTAAPGVLSEDRATPASPLGAGAGRIDPTRAATPGLVLEVPAGDYLRYLKGQVPADVPTTDAPPLPAADLNLPSVSFSALAHLAATRRTVTSTEPETSTWKVTVEGMAGVETTVTPSSFDVARGQSQGLDIKLRTTDAPVGEYVSGTIVLTNRADQRTVRLPMAARPVRIAAPRSIEVPTDQDSGRAPVRVKAGYEGDLSAAGWGLATPQPHPGQKVGAGRDDKPFAPSAGVATHDVEVPYGAQLLAGQIDNADNGDPDTDLDFFLFYDAGDDGFDAGDKVAESADGDANEAVALALPKPGRYRFSVIGFKTRDPYTTFDLTTWLAVDPGPDDQAVPAGGPGLALTGDPKTVFPGEEATVGLEWSGLPADGIYLGLATFHDTAAPAGTKGVTRALVRILRAAPGKPPPRWHGT